MDKVYLEGERQANLEVNSLLDVDKKFPPKSFIEGLNRSMEE